MSIVFINYPLETFTPTSSGALATIIWECCRRARQEGVEPYVITRSSKASRFDWPRTITLDYPSLPQWRIGTRVLRAQRRLTGWRHLRHRAYAFKVAQAIQKHGLSDHRLVLINDPEMAVYLRRRFPKAFLLHWFQNQMDSAPRFRAKFGDAVDVVAGVSDFTSHWIANYYAVEQVQTLYNAVDSEQFRRGTVYDGVRPIINFVGRTGIEKAPDLLLRACLALTGRTTQFDLQLIGSNHWDRFEMDDYQRELHTLAIELERTGVCVRRPGHVGRLALPGEIRKAQIHVVPSRWDEPFGLTTLEGMASGLATVASRTGGTPEVVGNAGLLFERDNVGELTDRLEEFVKDQQGRREYAQAARARAEEFTWERTWNRLKHLTGV